jgi:N-acetylmuramoyl-L-alanine amidase
MEVIAAPSPNFNARSGPPDMIVLHYTGMASGEAALARLRDPASEVSAHYLVEEDGRIFALVPEERRAWHAGRAFWAGQSDINAISVGVEIVNPGHEWGYRDFPQTQIEAVIELVGEIRSRWTIEDGRILGHSDVAPDRKTDPGERFPWKRLAEAGHGLWVEPPPAPGPPLGPGDRGLGVLVVKGALARLGYAVDPVERYDAALAVTVSAFQRHWAPHRLDGVADGATRSRLLALARAVSEGRAS